MAPSRGKGKTRVLDVANTVTSSTRRTPRSTRKTQVDDGEIYQDMLAEAAVVDPTATESDRPLKKRKVFSSSFVPGKVGSGYDDRDQPGSTMNANETGSKTSSHSIQRIEDSSESDGEDDSDFTFEDVDLDQPTAASPTPADNDIADISVSLDTSITPKRRLPPRRKPASIAEKAFRLLVHKLHVLCLLGHCMYINNWCNNIVVQRHLLAKLAQKTILYLNPKETDSQFQRNRTFMEGLQQAADSFRAHFAVTASGMRKARWAAEEEESISQADTEPMDRSDFITAAKNMEGSQDTANQLFCSLLRSCDVEARLICSLQPLPFANISGKSSTPQKPVKHTIFASATAEDSAASDSNTKDQSIRSSATIGEVPSVRRRLGQPSFPNKSATARTPEKKTPIRRLAYPVFWVEAFNDAHQKWIALDPIVTESINKPSWLEPPSSYELNQMSYVIAFEDDGVARDVTRRYPKAYNAKTRRRRIESTENGSLWFRKAMRVFRRRGGALDREQVEDAELARKEAREGLPTNVQNFKDHPYYALERHLKRHEVIHPKREVGKVNAGTAAKPRMEAVFRRQDVLLCRSADKWYRLGREVQKGEQPVKFVPARARRMRSPKDGSDGEDTGDMTPLNAYGNLDIYVPSMVPAGGSHIRHELAQHAARILRIDYAESVTGFQFKGRHGTAIKEGVVVAAQYEEAIWAVIEGMKDEQAEEDAMARSAVALTMWKQFLKGLRIAERVSGYGDKSGIEEMSKEMDEDENAVNDTAEAGGFFPIDADEEFALPTAGRFSLEELSGRDKTSKRGRLKQSTNDDESMEDAEFMSDVESHVVDFPPRRSTRSSRRVIDEDTDEGHSLVANNDAAMADFEIESSNDLGGGFVPDHTDEDEEKSSELPPEDAGGFVVDDVNGDDRWNNDSTLFPTTDVEMTDDFMEGEAKSVSREPIVSQVADLEPEGDNLGQGSNLQHLNIRDQDSAEAPYLDPSQHDKPPASNATEAAPLNNTVKSKDDTVLEDPEAVTAEVEESDQGSMMSHDPEDDDAEPDWLESD